jgi:hypothetical protein
MVSVSISWRSIENSCRYAIPATVTFTGGRCCAKALKKNAGSSPIDIVVNGSKIKGNYSPPSGTWVSDTFDITGQMKDGANTIRLEFQSGAQTNY